MSVNEIVLHAGEAIGLLGVAFIVVGVTVSTAKFLAGLSGKDFDGNYNRYKQGLGKSILLGLELLVAGDIIRSVGGPLEIENIVALGLLVIIRSIIRITLDMEIDGHWPWQRNKHK